MFGRLTGNIRNRIALGILLVFGIPYSVIMIISYVDTRQSIFDTALHEARTTAQMLAISSHLEDEKYDVAAMGDLVLALKLQKRYIDDISIIDRDNKVISSSEEEAIGKLRIEDEVTDVLEQNKEFIAHDLLKESAILRIISPIAVSRGAGMVVVAAVEQRGSLKHEFEVLRRNRLYIIGAGVVIVVAIILMVIYMSGKITRPVHKLYEAFQSFEGGDLNISVDAVGRDEIAGLTNSFNKMVRTRKAYIEAVQRFLPRDFLNFLGKNDLLQVALGDAVQRDFTILFSDMRHFSSISEKMTPKEVLAFVNGYLGRIAPIIRASEGFIITYIGDAIMAAFPESADSALQCAMRMQRAIDELNEERVARGEVAIHIGIGINAGTSTVGILGAEDRLEAAVMSDVVNVAARLESLTKMYGCRTIFSATIFDRLYNPEDIDLRYRHLDTVRVKGVEKAVDLYELFSGDDDLTTARRENQAKYEEALSSYSKGNFEEAENVFRELDATQVDDPTIKLFLSRIERMKANPPSAWDGVTTLHAK